VIIDCGVMEGNMLTFVSEGDCGNYSCDPCCDDFGGCTWIPRTNIDSWVNNMDPESLPEETALQKTCQVGTVEP